MAGIKISNLTPLTPLLTDLVPLDRPTTGAGAPVTGQATLADIQALIDTGGGGGGNEYWESTVAGEIFATGSLVAVTGSLWAQFLSASNGLEITGSFTHGTNVTASGQYSHAQGDSITASGQYSHAQGGGTTASGIASHAEGSSTTASGDASHAEGKSTTASGDYSHSEGNSTTASGYASHAEGDVTSATNDYAHAEGGGTTASGEASHSEGFNTTASGNYSHAQGDSTTASGNASHAEGVNTTASGEGSHAEGASGGGGSLIASGYASHAEGYNTIASGQYSHAEGDYTTAAGEASHSEGDYTTASGSYSHAEGTYTIADGLSSHAEGWGSATHLRGFTVVYVDSDGVDPANGIFQLDSVYGDITADIQSTTNFTSRMVTDGDIAGGFIGDRRVYDFVGTNFESPNTWITCSNPYGMSPLTAIPYAGSIIASLAPLQWQLSTFTTPPDQAITGTISHAEGIESISIGSGSHAEGFRTLAVGVSKDLTFYNLPGDATWGAHAEGLGTIAYGNASHSEGEDTLASGDASHAEGDGTLASGYASHAEGASTTASGVASHAEGSNAHSYGNYSHAEGEDSRSGFLGYNIASFTSDGGDYVFELDKGYGDITGSIFTEFPDQDGNFHTRESEYGWIGTSFDGTNTWVTGSGATPSFPTVLTRFGINVPTGADTTMGDMSHSEGRGSISAGYGSHAEGGTDGVVGSIAFGTYSHAEGLKTYAKGEGSHAEGIQSISSGTYSHAEGEGTTASGYASHAEGQETIASGSYQHVQGKFNLRNNDFSIFVIGNGIADDDVDRSDVVRVNLGIPGSGSFEVTGTVYATVGFSGSLTQLTDGRSYLVAGTDIGITTASDGQVTIGYIGTGGGGGGDQFWQSTTAGQIFATGTLGASLSGSIRALYLSASTGGEITGSLVVSGTGTSTFTAYTGVRYFPDIVTSLPFTASLTDYIIAVSSSNPLAATDYGIELPGAEFGRTFVVKDISGSAASSNITVTAAGSTVIQRSIDGASNYVLSINRGSATFVYFGDMRGWGVI